MARYRITGRRGIPAGGGAPRMCGPLRSAAISSRFRPRQSRKQSRPAGPPLPTLPRDGRAPWWIQIGAVLVAAGIATSALGRGHPTPPAATGIMLPRSPVIPPAALPWPFRPWPGASMAPARRIDQAFADAGWRWR